MPSTPCPLSGNDDLDLDTIDFAQYYANEDDHLADYLGIRAEMDGGVYDDSMSLFTLFDAVTMSLIQESLQAADQHTPQPAPHTAPQPLQQPVPQLPQLLLQRTPQLPPQPAHYFPPPPPHPQPSTHFPPQPHPQHATHYVPAPSQAPWTTIGGLGGDANSRLDPGLATGIEANHIATSAVGGLSGLRPMASITNTPEGNGADETSTVLLPPTPASPWLSDDEDEDVAPAFARLADALPPGMQGGGDVHTLDDAARYITRMTGEVSRLEEATNDQEAQELTELDSIELYLQL